MSGFEVMYYFWDLFFDVMRCVMILDVRVIIYGNFVVMGYRYYFEVMY